MRRVVQALLIPVLTVAFLSSTVGHAAAQDKKSPVFKTPEDVVAAATAAAAKEDLKALLPCFTDDLRDTIAGGFLFGTAFMKGFMEAAGDKLTDDQKEMLKQLNDVYKKHGLTDEAVKKQMPKSIPNGDPDAMRKLFIEFAGVIKDRPGFIADIGPIIKKGAKGERNFLGSKDAKVKDVKIDGTSAKGTLVWTKDEKETTGDITFKKVGDSWKIDSVPETNRKGPKGK